MLFLNNAFTKDITEYDGEVLKEVKTVDGRYIFQTALSLKRVLSENSSTLPLMTNMVLYLRLTVPMRSVLSLDSLLLRAIPLLIISHSDYQSLINCGRAIRFSVFMTSVGFAAFIN